MSDRTRDPPRDASMSLGETKFETLRLRLEPLRVLLRVPHREPVVQDPEVPGREVADLERAGGPRRSEIARSCRDRPQPSFATG